MAVGSHKAMPIKSFESITKSSMQNNAAIDKNQYLMAQE